MLLGRLLILTAALSSAPFQCGRAPTADSRIEETAAEALYRLAGEFRARGELDAAKATLRHLVERYPGSREAHLATDDLAGLEGTPSATPR